MGISKISVLFKYSLAAVAIVLITLVGCSSIYKGPVSDNFDGTRFYHNERDYTFSEFLKWMWMMDPAEWPEWIEDPNYPIPPALVGRDEIRVTHVNQATILIQTNNFNILTDPIWSERSSPVSWTGPKRVRAPGVKFEDLPSIDLILLSHDHYDHLDLPTLKDIRDRDNPKIIVGLGVGSRLHDFDKNKIHELDWWQSYTESNSEIKVTFVPSRHNSGRGIFDKNKTLWGGFVIESPSGRIYFAGDTGYGEFLEKIRNKFKSFRIALLPVGHYEPRWMMETHHMNPDDAVKLHTYLNVDKSIGMHFGTFGGHNDEEVDEHEKDLAEALQKYSVEKSEFILLGFGEGKSFGE